ncbi:MAG: C4-dicarboxylate ABC transporter permease, partial [Kiloniellaceae bacterium]|nr:C4-dicarboxylate ABC transporter permease [Kiloniellaceae bacterium]
LVLIPFGWMAIKLAKRLLQAPRNILMPVILAFCIVGAFASNNAAYGIVIMLAFGVLGFIMEENGIPLAPCILGIVIGPIVERSFVTTMIKADGDLVAFFERPIAAGLGIVVILIWALSLYGWVKGQKRPLAP